MRKLTFAQACAQFANRYTAEHVPSWARKAAPNGLFYAPQYTSDREWYENTKFYGEPGHFGRRNERRTTGQTGPFGQWLKTPYTVGGYVLRADEATECSKPALMTIQTPEFQQFLRGYVAALLWSSTDEVNGETVNLDDGHATSTQADDHCRAACLAFFEANRADIEAAAMAYKTKLPERNGYAAAGHDFALTRNGHGAGFWDGGLPDDLGARLTEASKIAGECWPYLGDDGTVYIQ